MTRRAWVGLAVALLAGLGGCDDPSVQVVFELPEPQRAEVASVTLEILVPPPAEPFDCDAVAYQDVGEDAVRLSRVQQVSVALGESIALSGIPRAGAKLLVARGLDAQNVTIAAGCAPLGEVEGDVEVRIAGEPATIVALPTVPLGEELPVEINLAVTDAGGRPLPDAVARWTLVGPGGEVVVGTALVDAVGRAAIAPGRPSLPGPAAFDVQVRWQGTAASRLFGFYAPPAIASVVLPGTAGSQTLVPTTETLYVVGRIGPAGQTGLAALGPIDETLTRRALVAWYDPSLAPPVRTSTTAPLTGVGTLGLARGATRDRVVATSPTAWLEIGADGLVVTRTPPVAGKVARRLLSVAPCDEPDPDEVLLVSYTDGMLVTVDGDGAAVASPFAAATELGRPAASGCVAGLGAEVHRAVVFAQGGVSQRIVADMDVLRAGEFSAFGFGVGFSPALGAAAPALLGGQLDLDGLSVTRSRLVPVGATALDAEVLDADACPSLALSTASGDVDGDGLVDVVSLLSFGEGDPGTEVRVFVALGVTHRGARLVGVSPPTDAVAPRILLADFDGDGTEDLVLATPGELTVFSMGL